MKNKKLDWCEIAHKIMELEQIIYVMGEGLTKKEIKQLYKEINNLEGLKAKIIKETPNFNIERHLFDNPIESELDIEDL